MSIQKLKWKIKHPFAVAYDHRDLSRDITVDVEGETYKGVPHGLCYISFIYNGEVEKDITKYKKTTNEQNPYEDG